jgi:YVTN family beta-propeller protein
MSGSGAAAPVPRGTVTFLFTDIEGSTQLLKQLGARYADALASHRRILRAASAASGGREVDSQGDSFFFAFGRAKDAVAAAVQGQRELAAEPWPKGAALRVRMGLHTGEPTVGDGRYVGLGVHKAARIAAAGHGGQILLSSTTRDLVEDELPDGVGLRDLGEHRLKDLDRHERIFQLVIEGLPSDFAALKTLDRDSRRRHRVRLLAGGLAALAVAIALGAFLALRSGGGEGVVAPNSVGLIDVSSNDLVGHVPVGIRPGPVVAGEDSVWVGNRDDKTLTRIDSSSHEVVRTIGLDATPTGVADGEGGVWVAEGSAGAVARIDSELNDVAKTIGGLTGTVRVSGTPTGSVTVGSGSVWAAFGSSDVVRIDPATDRVIARGFAGFSAAAIAHGEGAVWVVNRASNTVSQISPITSRKIADINVGQGPSGIAVGGGALWVSDTEDDAVSRIDVRTHASTTIPVGSAPVGIAYSPGAVWVANSGDGTISRIDPARNEVVGTIRIGSSPVGIALTGGLVWVTVAAP